MLTHFMKGYEIDPDSLEDSDVLQKLISKIPKKDLSWMTALFDKTITEYVELKQNKNKLVWTGFGPFVGEHSLLSEKQQDRFWKILHSLYKGHSEGAEKLRRQTGGTFFMWRIALREESWWSYDSENRAGKKDLVTGNVYKVYQYWINEDLKKKKPKK